MELALDVSLTAQTSGLNGPGQISSEISENSGTPSITSGTASVLTGAIKTPISKNSFKMTKPFENKPKAEMMTIECIGNAEKEVEGTLATVEEEDLSWIKKEEEEVKLDFNHLSNSSEDEEMPPLTDVSDTDSKFSDATLSRKIAEKRELQLKEKL